MSLYFITKRKDHLITDNRIKVVNDLSIVSEYLTKVDQIGFDKEFSSLNLFRAVPLLTQIGDKHNQYVIDDTSVSTKALEQQLSELLLIGHNIKIDYQIHKLQGLKPFRKVYDTMIAEQIITRGCGYSNSLDNTVARRLSVLPLAKDVRISFTRMNVKSVFENRHILYAADDVIHLGDLKEAQEKYIERRGLEKDLYEIEFPLVTLLGDAELQGCKLDEDLWRQNIRDNRDKALELENNMNKKLLSLRDSYEKLKNITIKSETTIEQSVQMDLFGEGTFIETSNKRGINYSSSQQVLNLFSLMGIPKPKIKEKDKVTKIKEEKESVKEEALSAYIIANRDWLDPRVIDFVEDLLQYKKAIKNISSFGERFLVETYRKGTGKDVKKGYKSLITGKVHTCYHQCGTDTTRMSSGSAGRRNDKGEQPDVVYFNSQQIPKPNNYRHCFVADDGYNFTTCDLSGAELVIAASNSGDKRLIELAMAEDKHSPLATVSYNEIVSYITHNMVERRAKEELHRVLKANARTLNITEAEAEQITKDRVAHAMRFKSFEVTSKTAKDIREDFKQVVYGLAYGASADRIMEVLGIAKAYAVLVEKAMRKELPDFFAYQDKMAQFVLDKGYIKFHPDYGSVCIFPKILDYKKWRKPLPNDIKGEAERAAKNYPIQGTQGLMIKRATVEYFYDYVFPNHYDVSLVFQVHDENVVQHLETEPQHGIMLAEIMNNTASKFLKGVKMNSNYVTMKTWHK